MAAFHRLRALRRVIASGALRLLITMELFKMAFEKFNATAAALSDAADRAITAAQDSAPALAAAQQALADADDTATAAIQPIADKLIAAFPAPAQVDPAADPAAQT